MIFITKGIFYMGITQRDADGNITKQTPPRFEETPDGSCVAVGIINSDTNEQEGAAEIFGDWDAAHFLAKTLEYIAPTRPVNIPDFKEIIHKAYTDGTDICQYCTCNVTPCRDCIVEEWKNDTEAYKNVE